MVLNGAASILLRMLSVYLLLTAIAGPVYTFFLWKHATYLHQMHTQGVETKARIEAANVKQDIGRVLKGVYFDIAWSDKQGGIHRAKKVELSQEYGMHFLAYRSSIDVMYGHYMLAAEEVPIKYIAADPQQFILSADPKNSGETQAGIMPWAQLISAIGVAGAPLFFLLRRIDRQRKAEAEAQPGGISPEQAAAKEEEGEQAVWLLLSLLFYAIAAGIHFYPEVHATDIKAFGAAPFGLPVTLVVIVIGTVLYMPFAWMLRHFLRLAAQARKEDPVYRAIPYAVLVYILTAGGHAHLRNSRTAVLLGMLYLFGLFAAWIAYTSMKGI
jgi:cytochrome bd-type quinol oxidase subunit 2